MKKQNLIVGLLSLGTIVSGLTGCADGNDQVVVYTAAEEERIDYLKKELSAKFPDVQVVFQAIGTGTLVTKLQAEGQSTDCDIFYDLEACNAQRLVSENADLFYDLGTDYDFSIYDSSVMGYASSHHKFAVNGKTCGAIVTSKKVLAEAGLSTPKTYEDLLNEKFKNLIVMPNPKSSGTGYAFYNGVVSSKGEDYAKTYFASLNENVKEYTTSGSAPIKSVNKGEIAAAVCMLWQGVEYANENDDLEVVFLDNEASYNLFTMGIINGKEKKDNVKKVFDYLYNDLNEKEVTKYNPDKIYKDQGASEIPNYPTGFSEINMGGVFDFEYKQKLLDAWKY